MLLPSPPSRAAFGGRPALGRREDADREAERFFEEHWRKGDAWSFDSSPWETTRLDRLRDVVASRHYERALEIGCGTGTFLKVALARSPATDVLGADTFEGRYTAWRKKLPKAIRARVSPGFIVGIRLQFGGR